MAQQWRETRNSIGEIGRAAVSMLRGERRGDPRPIKGHNFLTSPKLHYQLPGNHFKPPQKYNVYSKEGQ